MLLSIPELTFAEISCWFDYVEPAYLEEIQIDTVMNTRGAKRRADEFKYKAIEDGFSCIDTRKEGSAIGTVNCRRAIIPGDDSNPVSAIVQAWSMSPPVGIRDIEMDRSQVLAETNSVTVVLAREESGYVMRMNHPEVKRREFADSTVIKTNILIPVRCGPDSRNTTRDVTITRRRATTP